MLKAFSIPRLLCGAFVALGFLLLPCLATACTLCIGLPKETTADFLLKSHCVILARQAADNPYAYSPRETLKGRYDGTEIDLLVDSVTRRRLSVDDALCVLLTQSSERGQWRNLGIVSEEFEAVVRRILLFAPEWEANSGQQRRFEYFLSLFGSKDRSIHGLAYLEMGRAPYAVIRELGGRIERRDIAPMLDNAQYLEWRPLAILLLGLSDTQEDQQEVINAFHTSERLRLTTNLAAWATAAIEVKKGAAIDDITEQYCSDPNRTQDELEAVIKAMSLHGTEGHTHLRDEIIASYEILVDVHPHMAARVARDLSLWNRADVTVSIKANQAEKSLATDGTR